MEIRKAYKGVVSNGAQKRLFRSEILKLLREDIPLTQYFYVTNILDLEFVLIAAFERGSGWSGLGFYRHLLGCRNQEIKSDFASSFNEDKHLSVFKVA